MEGEHRWPALLSPHTTGVSWLVQLWSVGSPPVLPGPLGFHAGDSIPVLAQVPSERGLWDPG